MTGSDVERQFINIMSDKHGYSCLRSPGSGGRTERDRPDAICLRAGAMEPDVIIAAEIKKRPDGTVTFTREEIEALERWAETAGAEPYAIVKPDLRKFDHWLVMHTSVLHETEKGYSIRKQDHDRCESIPTVFR